MEKTMNKTTIMSLARLWLATILIFIACGSDDGGNDNNGNGDKVSCQTQSGCALVSDADACFSLGGSVIQTCPNNGGGSSSSGGNGTPSSSGGGNSSSSSGGNGHGSLEYEGKTYKTVKIGFQTWMAENLNYNVEGSKCYDNSESNCNIYGRLYDWATAMSLDAYCNSYSCAPLIQTNHRGICPTGWHIPSKAEWETLTTYVEVVNRCTHCDAKYLKSTTGWNESGNGTDDYGFAALPGSRGESGGNFYGFSNVGYWWSASEVYADYAYYRSMNYSDESNDWDYNDKVNLFSVRCLQD
jgi:uncharacterized protein (TIGR02145 family)